MNVSSDNKNDSLLKFLSKGLELWIRSKCQSVGKLSLDIHGSGFQLLRGKLSSIYLKGEEVCFEDVLLKSVIIECSSLKLSFNLNRIIKPISLHEPFNINCYIELSEVGVNRFFCSVRWHELTLFILSQLIQQVSFLEASLKNESLCLKVEDNNSKEITEEEFSLKANYGTIVIYRENTECAIPMDDAISIDEAYINQNIIFIKGLALVSP